MLPIINYMKGCKMITMCGNRTLNCAFLSLLLMAYVLPMSSVAAPTGKKAILGYGWEFLAIGTEDVYRNREKLAAVGYDGYLLPIDRQDADGKLVRARDLLADPAWREADFERSVVLLRDCLTLPGLKESLAFGFLIPAKRLAWTDDAAWANASSNAAVFARLARKTGFRGVCLDHEDYTKQSQFRLRDGDPDYDEACRLARQRGRQFFGAFFAEFPEARLLTFWLFTEWREIVRAHDVAQAARELKGDLWHAFLNGLLDVVPPTAKFVDGNETTGYKTVGGPDAFRAAAYETIRDVLPLVAPENRVRYTSCVSVGFGQYIDSYTLDEKSSWSIPSLGGSKLLAFQRNLLAATAIADDYVWVYGERGQTIDWGRTDHRWLKFQTWESQLPGFGRMIRLASGGMDAARALVSEGAMTNLVANSSCDGDGAAVPSGFTTWTREKNAPADRFVRDAHEGFSAPGCLRVNGVGSFTVTADDLRPGEALYMRVRAKGRHPSVTVGWKRDGQWNWKIPVETFLSRADADAASWRTFEGIVVVPENINGLGFILGSTDGTVLYDDVEIYR